MAQDINLPASGAPRRARTSRVRRNAEGRLEVIPRDELEQDLGPDPDPSTDAALAGLARAANPQSDDASAAEPEIPMWRRALAMAPRGLAGLVPGGPWGAAAGAAGETIGEMIEGRPELNKTQIAAQAALGAIPFGKLLKVGHGLASGLLQGAIHGATASGVTESAETGELPTARGLAFGAATGGLGGGLAGMIGAKVAAGEAGTAARTANEIETLGGTTVKRMPAHATEPIRVKSHDAPPRARSAVGFDPTPGETPAHAPIPEADHYMPNTSAENHGSFGDPAEQYQSPVDRYAPNTSASPTPETWDAPGEVSPEIEAASRPAKPRLGASDVRAMLEGRTKFAEKNPAAPLAPGAQDSLDRYGVEYGRTQSELKRLLNVAEPSAEEAADVPRYKQAARELGSRLSKASKEAALGGKPAAIVAPVAAAAVPDDPDSNWDDVARIGLMSAGVAGMGMHLFGGKGAANERLAMPTAEPEAAAAPRPQSPHDKIAALLAGEKPEYAKVPFNVADQATQDGLVRNVDYNNPRLQNVSLSDLIATQPTVTRNVVLDKLGQTSEPMTEVPRDAYGAPRSDAPVVYQGEDGKMYLGGGTHRATAAWARGDKDMQAVVYPPKAPSKAQGLSDLFRQTPAQAPEAETTIERPSFASKIASDVHSGRVPNAPAVSDSAYKEIRDLFARKPVNTPRAETTVEPGQEQYASKIATDVLGKGRVPDAMPVSDRGYSDLMKKFGGRLASDESGEMSPEMAMHLGSAAAGAGFGAWVDEDNRGEGALMGGVLGGVAPYAYRHPEMLEKLRFASMLSSPMTMAKNLIGNGGAITAEALERSIAKGDPSEGVNLLRQFFSPKTIQAGREAFMHDMPAETNKLGVDIPRSGLMSIPGRVMGATDAAAKDAIGRAGLSADEAARITFTNEPTSEFVRGMLQTQRKSPLARMTMPFIKTAANVMERGMDRTPVGLRRLADAAGDPEMQRRILTEVGLGAGASALGYEYGDQVNPYLAAATGPYAIPFFLGSAFSHGKTPTQQVNSAMRGLAQQIPMPDAYNIEQPGRNLATFIPNALRDVAELTDEFGYGTQRDSSGSFFDPTVAKIPFLRDQLPIKVRVQ